MSVQSVRAGGDREFSNNGGGQGGSRGAKQVTGEQNRSQQKQQGREGELVVVVTGGCTYREGGGGGSPRVGSLLGAHPAQDGGALKQAHHHLDHDQPDDDPACIAGHGSERAAWRAATRYLDPAFARVRERNIGAHTSSGWSGWLQSCSTAHSPL